MVGISLLTLVPGVVGGSETYARELCRALARTGTLEYRALLPALAPDAADGLPATVISAYRAGYSMRARIAAMCLATVRPGPIRRQMRLGELATIHFPMTVMLPLVSSPPAVTTLLDVQHELWPRFFSRAELFYRRCANRWTMRRSRLVIAISAHAARTLVERAGVHEKQVRVIHFGVDHERFHPGEGPREPFLLYPANRWPHKNHEQLFDAFALLRRARPQLRLVLTGAGHQERPLPSGVESPGHVPLDELARLYRRAAALVFPSLYEGFGLPVLEAMASGCPVACSDVASLPEIAGDAACTFDPTSAEEIAASVAEVLAHPDEWAARGLERAARFSWEECARQHDAVYRELGAGRIAAPSAFE